MHGSMMINVWLHTNTTSLVCVLSNENANSIGMCNRVCNYACEFEL